MQRLTITDGPDNTSEFTLGLSSDTAQRVQFFVEEKTEDKDAVAAEVSVDVLIALAAEIDDGVFMFLGYSEDEDDIVEGRYSTLDKSGWLSIG